jgi:hypothetical protein
MATPEAACGRLPLKGAPPAARQSRIRGGPDGLSIGLMRGRVARAVEQLI